MKELFFSSGELNKFQKTEGSEGEKPTYKGIGYAGGIIPDHWYYGRVMFDMTSIEIPDTVPVLHEHDTAKPLGFFTSCEISGNALNIDNLKFLSNDLATVVETNIKDGYPYQMSVYIEPDDIIQYASDDTVNGVSFKATAYDTVKVFKGGKLKEVSVVVFGKDDNTKLDKKFQNIKTEGGKLPNEPKDSNSDALAAENQQLKAQVAALLASQAAAKKASRLTELAAFKFSNDEQEVIAKMDDSAYELFKKRMIPASSNDAEKFTKPLAQGDSTSGKGDVKGDDLLLSLAGDK